MNGSQETRMELLEDMPSPEMAERHTFKFANVTATFCPMSLESCLSIFPSVAQPSHLMAVRVFEFFLNTVCHSQVPTNLLCTVQLLPRVSLKPDSCKVQTPLDRRQTLDRPQCSLALSH